MGIRIVTDSTCDLDVQTVAGQKIEVIPLPINQGENTFLDGVNMTREEFYTRFKPLLHMHLGNPTAHRARTQSRAMERLMEWLREYAPYERLAVVHAGVQEEAEALRQRVLDFLPGGKIPVVQITPVLGAHLGVGALGFACVSTKES